MKYIFISPRPHLQHPGTHLDFPWNSSSFALELIFRCPGIHLQHPGTHLQLPWNSPLASWNSSPVALELTSSHNHSSHSSSQPLELTFTFPGNRMFISSSPGKPPPMHQVLITFHGTFPDHSWNSAVTPQDSLMQVELDLASVGVSLIKVI